MVPRKLSQSGALKIPLSPCAGSLHTVGIEVALLWLLLAGASAGGLQVACAQRIPLAFGA